MCPSPSLLVIAGPNGSGKSTIQAGIPAVGQYVNADEIQRYLHCDALQAAQIAEKTRENLLRSGVNFTFETVLSTRRNLNLIQRAKAAGYDITCIFVLTVDPEINVRRVAQRVAKGGHPVPEEKIRSRYHRALGLLPELLRCCHRVYIFDNSRDRQEGQAVLIVECVDGQLSLYPCDVWPLSKLRELTGYEEDETKG